MELIYQKLTFILFISQMLWNALIFSFFFPQVYVFPVLKIAQTIKIWMMILVAYDKYIYFCVAPG